MASEDLDESVDIRLDRIERLTVRHEQLREVLIAYISKAKVLLDLLSSAMAAALGSRGFADKHGGRNGLGMHLDEYAASLGVPAPDESVVSLARALDARLDLVRDKLATHPRRDGRFARAWLEAGPAGNLEIRKFGEPVPDPTIEIDALDDDLATYTRAVALWVASSMSAS